MIGERVIRLTYFEGNSVPMVEIWTHTGEACDGVKLYDYLRTGYLPACETPREWLEMLANSHVAHLFGMDPSSVAATSWNPAHNACPCDPKGERNYCMCPTTTP